ncbi:hypothetical protein J1N35_021101 [Gossypium stocksii]|uniref:Retrotransposon gag domain-containing protein n=1 Tax=Gossypium stocksii TaxID=47602 RepID=A0A9D4A1M8_9ROSI|nr:hypothetical protein J1N35_021101 [Gossypium stocksii]
MVCFNKEMEKIQAELSQLDVKLDAKLETRLQGFKDDFKGEIRYELQHLRSELLVCLSNILATLLCLPMLLYKIDERACWGDHPQEAVLDNDNVRTIMLNLEGRALDWHYFHAQKHGGLQMLDWLGYALSLKERFGLRKFRDLMSKLVTLKQQVIIGSSNRSNTSKVPSKDINPALIAERKQNGLCFWCGVKYHASHRCVKGQLYQLLLELHSDGEKKDFQECSDQLEEPSIDDKPCEPVVSLHAIKGSQRPHTMIFKAIVGNTRAIVFVDSGSTHNFMDTKLVSKLSLSIGQQ